MERSIVVSPNEPTWLALPPLASGDAVLAPLVSAEDFARAAYPNGPPNVSGLLRELLVKLDVTETFFVETLPFLQRLVQRTDEFFPGHRVQLLVADETVEVPKLGACALIALSFLGVLDRRGVVRRIAGQEYNTFSFMTMWMHRLEAPLMAILHYFVRMARGTHAAEPVVLRRFQLPRALAIDAAAPVCSITAFANVPIEDTECTLHADFANKYPGGGTLEGGCVQEEILFVIKPECLLSMLLVRMLGDHEAFAIEGAERFCYYDGYGRAWKFAGDFVDTRAVKAHIIGVDASVNRAGMQLQFEEPLFTRDIRKCMAGLFKYAGQPYASGNWGCGAFGGDKHLKAVQQIIACSTLRCPLTYCCFNEAQLAREIEAWRDAFAGSTVAQVLEMYHSLTKDYVAKGTLLTRMVEEKQRLTAK